jgi:hypothetical protein
MRTIIAGSRDMTDYSVVCTAMLDFAEEVTEVVSGEARGVDRLGEKWATMRGIPVKRFPANWDRFGRSAGYKRNTEMARYAEALVAIWDGKSKGTKNMIDEAKRLGLVVHVHITEES